MLNKEKKSWRKKKNSKRQWEEKIELKSWTLQGISVIFVEDYGKATVSKPLDIRGKNTKDSLLNRQL